ncbi:MAG: hypothetical protein LQ342_001217 [Letrouitia transgressa]|nr:MAG: hypothetical protein LQ342_001217 [Letrouitia transgressa]
MTKSFQLKLLGWGSVGIVYRVIETVAVKRAFKDNNDGVRNEYGIYDLLDRYPSYPNIVRSIYRIPSANFLQYMSGGTLDERLRKRQTRDPIRGLVTKVNHVEPAALIWRWMAELTDAAAWLECLGYAHGDLRPSNLLLDSEDHLKIIDFDSTAAVGAVFDGCQPPYARVLGDEAAEDRGTFGYHGPRTEQFAIGSVIYYMTRGHELYDNEWLGEDHESRIVSLLQEMVFPRTSDSKVDIVICDCWHGRFRSIEGLKVKVAQLGHETDFTMARAMDTSEFDRAYQQYIKVPRKN